MRIDEAGNALILADQDSMVSLSGELPSSARPFQMQAQEIRLEAGRLVAREPDIHVLSMDGGQGPGIRAVAEQMVSSESWLEFSGSVDVRGVTDGEIPWELNAGEVRFESSTASASPKTTVTGLTASRGVVLSLPERQMRAVGESLQAGRLTGLMRLEGAPAKIESADLVHEADWIEFDVNLGFVVASGKGKVRPPEGSCTWVSPQA